MRKKDFNFLLNIGFDYYIEKENILGIFSPDFLQDAKYYPNIKEYIDIKENKQSRSLIYCEGGYLIASPINSKTLYKRYQGILNKVNGLSKEENYIKLT